MRTAGSCSRQPDARLRVLCDPILQGGSGYGRKGQDLTPEGVRYMVAVRLIPYSLKIREGRAIF
jgi:hypothetical protein